MLPINERVKKILTSASGKELPYEVARNKAQQLQRDVGNLVRATKNQDAEEVRDALTAVERTVSEIQNLFFYGEQ